MLVIVGPGTRAIFKRDSVEIVSKELIFIQREGFQYWSSQHGEIPLGPSEDIGLYTVGPLKVKRDGKEFRAIGYVCFALVPYGSGITKQSLRGVMVSGARAESVKEKSDNGDGRR
jgi:hypothetical protein